MTSPRKEMIEGLHQVISTLGINTSNAVVFVEHYDQALKLIRELSEENERYEQALCSISNELPDMFVDSDGKNQRVPYENYQKLKQYACRALSTTNSKSDLC